MDQVDLSIKKLSTTIDNFQVGISVYEGRSDYKLLKRIEDAFKLRRSKALLECAYKEQHVSINNSEDFSSFALEKPRLFKREKVRNECQQSATQGILSFSAIQVMINSWKISGDTLQSGAGKEGNMRSKLYEFILELSKNSWASFGEGYGELLLAEKEMFDEVLRFQEMFAELKKGKDCMTESTSTDTKMKLSMAQTGLDKMNFMRRLIILLVGVKDVDLSKHKNIADIILNRCQPLNLLDYKPN